VRRSHKSASATFAARGDPAAGTAGVVGAAGVVGDAVRAHNGAVSRKRVIVNGMVQGVGFRYYAEAQAGKLGLGGYVRNRSDGAVEAEIEGDDDAVERMLTWLHTGPRSASVESVQVTDLAEHGEASFSIRI
jgi:acylphosphatase